MLNPLLKRSASPVMARPLSGSAVSLCTTRATLTPGWRNGALRAPATGRPRAEPCISENAPVRWRALPRPVSDAVTIILIPRSVSRGYPTMPQHHEKVDDRWSPRRRTLLLVHARDVALSRVPRGIDQLPSVHQCA